MISLNGLFSYMVCWDYVVHIPHWLTPNLQKHQEELAKKLMENEGQEETGTLQAQENLSIKGQSARNLVMQKLLRKADVSLRNHITFFSLGLFSLLPSSSEVYSFPVLCCDPEEYGGS